MITDYDTGTDHGEVDVTQIIATLMGNADKGRAMVSPCPPGPRAPRPHGCDRALNLRS